MYLSTAEPADGPLRLSTAYRPGTTVSMSTSGWSRYPKNSTAFRGYGAGSLILVKAENGWRLFDSEKNELALDVSHEDQLETVIESVDLLHPPAGWTRLDHRAWVKGEWNVSLGAAGWRVSHPRCSTRQVFRSADRARRWAELRFDRGGGARGPRCRADTRATKTLPDVRVTEAERKDALDLAAELNLSFAELVRAALKTLRAEHAKNPLVYDPAEHVISLLPPGSHTRSA